MQTGEAGGGAEEAQGSGGEGARGAGLSPDEEPRTTGTLLILMLFMMALAAMWAIMYLTLLGR